MVSRYARPVRSRRAAAGRRPPSQPAAARRAPSPVRAARRSARRPLRRGRRLRAALSACRQARRHAPPTRHVDRVREDPDAGRVGAERDDRLACERAYDEHRCGRSEDGRHGRRLDGAAPAGLRPSVVAFDQQHVRHAAQAAPRGGLRCECAPARDDDDVRLSLLQRIEDRRRDRVVVRTTCLAPGTEKPRRKTAVWWSTTSHWRGGGDRVRGIDGGQLDVGERGDPIEQRRAIRRRLGETKATLTSGRPSRRACGRSRASAAVRGLRLSFPSRRTWLASWSV